MRRGISEVEFGLCLEVDGVMKGYGVCVWECRGIGIGACTYIAEMK